MCQSLIYLLTFKIIVMGMCIPEKSPQEVGPCWAELSPPYPRPQAETVNERGTGVDHQAALQGTKPLIELHMEAEMGRWGHLSDNVWLWPGTLCLIPCSLGTFPEVVRGPSGVWRSSWNFLMCCTTTVYCHCQMAKSVHLTCTVGKINRLRFYLRHQDGYVRYRSILRWVERGSGSFLAAPGSWYG